MPSRNSNVPNVWFALSLYHTVAYMFTHGIVCPRGFYGKDCHFQCLDCPLNSCYPTMVVVSVLYSSWTAQSCRQGKPEFILYLASMYFAKHSYDRFYCDSCDWNFLTSMLATHSVGDISKSKNFFR
jgi:hypothetical protein